ncbi:hypothetical protein [Persephonella sp.]
MRFTAFFLTYLLFLLITAPVRLTINFIARHLFQKFKFKPELFDTKEKDLGISAKAIHERLLKNIDRIKTKGDSAKFVGLWYVATGDKEVLKLLKEYVKGGIFHRKPGQTTDKNFSGDMFSGIAYAEVFGNTDEEFKKDLLKALKSSIFEKPFLTLKSSSNKIDRGYLLRPFFLNAGHFLPILTALQLLIRLDDSKKNRVIYRLMYALVLTIAAPDIIVNPTFFIRIGKFRYEQWYYVHSCFLYYRVLYTLTKNPLYRRAFRFIYERFPFNPDFAGFEGVEYIVMLWLNDYLSGDKINPFKHSKQTVYNIKDLIRRKPAKYKEYSFILPARFRRNDYQWEKALNNDEYNLSVLSGIDFLHAYYLLRRSDGEDN